MRIASKVLDDHYWDYTCKRSSALETSIQMSFHFQLPARKSGESSTVPMLRRRKISSTAISFHSEETVALASANASASKEKGKVQAGQLHCGGVVKRTSLRGWNVSNTTRAIQVGEAFPLWLFPGVLVISIGQCWTEFFLMPQHHWLKLSNAIQGKHTP